MCMCVYIMHVHVLLYLYYMSAKYNFGNIVGYFLKLFKCNGHKYSDEIFPWVWLDYQKH